MKQHRGEEKGRMSFKSLDLGDKSHSLNFCQALGEFLPVCHDSLRTNIFQHPLHLSLLLGTMVASHVAHEVNTSSEGTGSTALAVLDYNTIFWFLAELIEGEVINSWIRLGGRWEER
jgi:hypothetical protein